MKLGDSGTNMNIETVPTGSISLDIALGLGGVPKGRVIEIYGPESSGKTTVALHMVAEVQKRGGIAGFIDAEHALDPVYAKNIGVDIDNLYISQPDNGEQALEITETMVRSPRPTTATASPTTRPCCGHTAGSCPILLLSWKNWLQRPRKPGSISACRRSSTRATASSTCATLQTPISSARWMADCGRRIIFPARQTSATPPAWCRQWPMSKSGRTSGC